MSRLQRGVGRLMKDEGWLVDEVLGGSGRCVSPKGGGGLGGQGGVDGGWGSRASPQGGLGGEKAVCLADKIHGRPPSLLWQTQCTQCNIARIIDVTNRFQKKNCYSFQRQMTCPLNPSGLSSFSQKWILIVNGSYKSRAGRSACSSKASQC